MAFESNNLLRRRLYTQYLEGRHFSDPAEVANWFGAVQSQDFAGAAWALCQRTANTTVSDFAEAFARGDILRTHVMRPTWHFVAPEDIRWMLDLSREHLLQATAYYYRQFELDERTLAKTDAIICRALGDGQHLTRPELASRLTLEGIDVTNGVRLAYVVGHAETLALICSGAPKGKQQTYALLEKRAPQAKILDRQDALAELTTRYYRSHGPATIADYAWWSGLTKKEGQMSLHSVEHLLEHETIDGITYWYASGQITIPEQTHAHLLPNYDEYVVGYTERTNLFDERHATFLDSRQNPLFNNVLLIAGVIAGTWKKVVRSKALTLEITLFRTITSDERQDIQDAAERYAAHLSSPTCNITWS